MFRYLAIGSLLAAPLWAAFILSKDPAIAALCLLGEYLTAECWFGPTLASLFQVVPRDRRGTAQVVKSDIYLSPYCKRRLQICFYKLLVNRHSLNNPLHLITLSHCILSKNLLMTSCQYIVPTHCLTPSSHIIISHPSHIIISHHAFDFITSGSVFRPYRGWQHCPCPCGGLRWRTGDE